MPLAPTYGSRWPTYAGWWDIATIRPQQAQEVHDTVQRLLRNKSRYQNIERLTNVPWMLIAALHERESGGRFDRQLAQGDRLDRQSTNEPIAGPFKTFEDSAIWALHHDHLDRVIDWRVEKMLFWAESWNGWGLYWYHPHTPSSYVVGATSVQRTGKYIADHVWSSTEWDKQIGVMAMLLEFGKQDASIQYIRETPADTPGDVAAPTEPPTPQRVAVLIQAGAPS